MAIAVRVLKTATVNGEDGTLAMTSDYAVPSGAVLALIGAGSSDGLSPYLSSVADTSANTWGNVTNVRASGTYSPQVFAALAHNVAAATPTVTATYTESTSGNRFSAALLEITDVPTSGALDVAVNNIASSGTSITTGATGALAQAANLLIACMGGWIGIPYNPSGWSSVLTQSNGIAGLIGCQISYKTIDDAASRTETFSSSEIAGGALLMLVIRQEAGPALQYKFQLNTATFTSADTAIEGAVWRNATPFTGLATKFTGLAGDAVAGDLIIPADVNAALTDTLYGIFYNGTDTSGLITGVVEAV